MEAISNFVTENTALLIVIGVAVVLLIIVSIFGKVKSKMDEEKEKATNNAAAGNPVESTENVEVVESEVVVVQEASVEEVPEETIEDAKPVTDTDEEEVIVTEPAVIEEKNEEKPAKKSKKSTKKVVEEDVLAESVVEEKEEVKAEEPTVEVAVEENVAAETEEKTSLPGTVEVYKGKNDFYFSFRASNNILIGRSQGYTTKDACKKGVIAVMNAAKEAEIRDSVKADDEKAYKPAFGKTVFEIYEDKEGKYRWRLFAKNQQNILASKGYTAKAGAKRAVQSLKKIAANYVLTDLTKAK